MQKPILTVMVSSTVLDLREDREEVRSACELLGMFPKMMDNRPASPVDKVRDSLQMVDEADIYVGIIGNRYGDLPDAFQKSITELEYDRAVERRIAIFMFLTKDASSSPTENDEAQIRLKLFREKLDKGHTCPRFGSPQELAKLVTAALARHVLQMYEMRLADSEPDVTTAARMTAASEVAVNLYAERISEWFNDRYLELKRLASQPELQTNDVAGHAQVILQLSRMTDTYPGGIYSLNETGVVLYHETPLFPQMNIRGFNASQREYFTLCRDGRRPVTSNSFRSADRSEDILVIAVPRLDGSGNFIGILDGVIDISKAPFSRVSLELTRAVTNTKLQGFSIHLVLLDRRSMVLGSNIVSLTGTSLGGHSAIRDLDPAAGSESPVELKGYGAMRQVKDTPFITVAYWSRQSQ